MILRKYISKLEEIILGDEETKNLPAIQKVNLNKPSYYGFALAIPLSALTSIAINHFTDDAKTIALGSDLINFLSYQTVYIAEYFRTNKKLYTINEKFRPRLALYHIIACVPAQNPVGVAYHLSRDSIQAGLIHFCNLDPGVASLIGDTGTVFPFVFLRNKLVEVGSYIINNGKSLKEKASLSIQYAKDAAVSFLKNTKFY